MLEVPSFVGTAALIGDPARARMLARLMGGQALTASELALEADISKSTASSHLGKLVAGGLLSMLSQGRHRYFQIASSDVAQLLETMMLVTEHSQVARVIPGPRDPALRKARVCYDHLAGELAVALYENLVKRGFLRLGAGSQMTEPVALSATGNEFFSGLGIAISACSKLRRPLCRPCLDWSLRRHHLSGSLGSLILDYCYEKRWAKRQADSRIVHFSVQGEQQFQQCFLD